MPLRTPLICKLVFFLLKLFRKVPLQGPQNRVKVFYIRDSVDAAMMSRGKVFRDPGFQPHIDNIGKYFTVIEDEWWMAPPQGINYTVNK